MIADHSLLSSLQSVIHHRAFPSLSLFSRCYFDFSSSELASSAPVNPTFVHLSRSRTSSYPYRVSTQECSTLPFQLPFFPGASKLWNVFPISISHPLGNSQRSGSNTSVPRHHPLQYHLIIEFTSQIAGHFICYNNLDFQLTWAKLCSRFLMNAPGLVAPVEPRSGSPRYGHNMDDEVRHIKRVSPLFASYLQQIQTDDSGISPI